VFSVCELYIRPTDARGSRRERDTKNVLLSTDRDDLADHKEDACRNDGRWWRTKCEHNSQLHSSITHRLFQHIRCEQATTERTETSLQWLKLTKPVGLTDVTSAFIIINGGSG